MTKKLKFDSILIVTYGRSGSTLLQGIINSHEEVLVRGENYNFCYGLFESYKSLKKTAAKTHALNPEIPFFGSVFFDEVYYISMVRKMVKNLLFGDQIGNEKIKCYGFKEIRYEKNPESIGRYLNFLKQIFPNPAFIINTRNMDAVINSRDKIQWKGKRTISSLQQTEAAFHEFAKKNLDCSFHITYEDVVGKTERLQRLYSFLGLPYSEERINRVLEIKHSIDQVQDEVSKLKSPSRNIDIETKDFRIVSFEDRHLAQLEKDLRNKEQKLKKRETSFYIKIRDALRWFVSSFFKFSNKK